MKNSSKDDKDQKFVSLGPYWVDEEVHTRAKKLAHEFSKTVDDGLRDAALLDFEEKDLKKMVAEELAVQLFAAIEFSAYVIRKLELLANEVPSKNGLDDPEECVNFFSSYLDYCLQSLRVNPA
jgi:hypothetical protein